MSEGTPDASGRFPKGVSGNPGGRPRKLRELEALLDEHRSSESLRPVLERLRALALDGEPSAIRLYLDRVLGPPQAVGYLLAEADVIDAPDAVLRWLVDDARRGTL